MAPNDVTGADAIELITNKRSFARDLPRLTRAIAQRTGRMDGTFRVTVHIEPVD